MPKLIATLIPIIARYTDFTNLIKFLRLNKNLTSYIQKYCGIKNVDHYIYIVFGLTEALKYKL